MLFLGWSGIRRRGRTFAVDGMVMLAAALNSMNALGASRKVMHFAGVMIARTARVWGLVYTLGTSGHLVDQTLSGSRKSTSQHKVLRSDHTAVVDISR